VRTCSLVLLSVVALTACASSGETGRLGDYSVHSPTLATIKGEARPTHLDVNLTTPGYVAVLFVIPGRGASLIYPGDSTTSNQLSAGTHGITTSFSDRSKLIDTTYFRGLPQRGDTTRNRPRPSSEDQARQRGRPFDASQLEREGYLLMIVTADPLNYASVARRIDGVTIPAEDEEALNTVAKLVVGTTTRDKPWSAYYKLVDVK
jgi:hypothetical protein